MTQHGVEGRVVIVTGAGQGIGRGIALHLAKHGASVTVAEWKGHRAERTVAEVVETMNAAQVACCPIMNSKDMAEDPHYKARGVHIEWEDGQAGKVKGTGVTPLFSLTPGKIWRGSVPVGQDNETVYTRLAGLSREEIGRLKEKGVI